MVTTTTPTPELMYGPGDVVQLRSGGPRLTVVETDDRGVCRFLYFNTVTGLFERASTDQRCLRGGTTQPEAPYIVPGPPARSTRSQL